MSEHRLLRTVLYLHHRLERAQRRADESLSLSQYRLLYMIQEGPARSVELALATDMTKPSIGAMVAQLESQGWIERQALDSDRRASVIQITATGREAVAQFERLLQAELVQFLGDESVSRADETLGWLFETMQARRGQAHSDWAHRVTSAAGADRSESAGQN